MNQKNRFLKVIVVILSIAPFLACKEKQEIKLQKELPKPLVTEIKDNPTSYETLEGKPIELNNFKGKKIFLNYWATWCRPCIEEMPALEQLQTILEKENYIFLFASDQSLAKIKKFKAERNFDLNFVKFNGSLGDLEIAALPVTIIYDEKGKQLKRFDGAAVWDDPDMIKNLKNL